MKKRTSNNLFALLVIAAAVAVGFLLPTAINAIVDKNMEEKPKSAEISIVDIASGADMTITQRLRLLMTYNAIQISAGNKYDIDSAREKGLEEIAQIEEFSSWLPLLEKCRYEGSCLLYVQSDDPTVSMVEWNIIFYFDEINDKHGEYISPIAFVLDEESGKILSVSAIEMGYIEKMDISISEDNGEDYNATYDLVTEDAAYEFSPQSISAAYSGYLGLELVDVYQQDDYGDEWIIALSENEDYIEIPLYFWDYGFAIGV